MDVQLSLNPYSSLNSAMRSPASAFGREWTDAINSALATPAIPAEPTQVPRSTKAFANLLNEAVEARPVPQPTPEESARTAALRKNAEMIVNKFFIGTMLKQMRESPFKSEMFSGGRGGEAFQGMMDQHLAENAGGHVAKSLVDSLVKSYRKQVGDPQHLFIDPKQQKQYEKYLEPTNKRVKHDAATSFTA